MPRARRLLILAVFIVYAVNGCKAADVESAQKPSITLAPGMSEINVPASLSESHSGQPIAVDIYILETTTTFRGDILVLPGWNFSRKEWQNKSHLVKLASEKNFRLIFPEMKTTLYESRYYPETRMKWAPTPGGQWVKEIFIPQLQRYGLLIRGNRNFLLGLSTGARGVALVTLQNPGLFTAGAALSGDYDQSAMPRDRLMTKVYGAYDAFPERWTGKDNPRKRISEWTMPIYLGHGHKDAVVPFSQTKTFYEALKTAHPALMIRFNEPAQAGHDFTYWASELPAVIDFFLSVP